MSAGIFTLIAFLSFICICIWAFACVLLRSVAFAFLRNAFDLLILLTPSLCPISGIVFPLRLATFPASEPIALQCLPLHGLTDGNDGGCVEV